MIGSQEPRIAAGGAARLIAAKLAPRPGAARSLQRQRLIDSIDQAVGAKLVLVRAPAGFGKTTFLIEYYRWLQRCDVATGWLTLDDADNDVTRFLTHVVAALQAIDPGLALTGGAAGERDLIGAAFELIHHLAARGDRFALFLDNLEAVCAPAVLGVLGTLLDALPPAGQLIVASREAPRLRLGRLRAHGHLAEISQDDLRFSYDESMTLLRERCQLRLEDRHVRLLHRRTEGWAAALWLAALALRGHDDADAFLRSFDGSHAAVADYLLDDVLSRLPGQSRSFLLACSVLDELDPDLCNAITGQTDSQARLEAFEQEGLFVIPQSRDSGPYRFHPLFRDFLCNELVRADPEATARLHRTAAAWFLAAGRTVEALEHLIRSGDDAAAVALLAEHAEHLLWKGRVMLLSRFLDRLPTATGAGAAPFLKCIYSWALLFTHRYDEALAQLEQVQAQRVDDPGIQVQLTVQRAFILAMTDRVEEALAAWEACKGQVAAREHPFAHSVQQNSHAFCMIAENRFDEARKVIAQGRPSHLKIGSAFNLAVGVCLEGSIDLAQGSVSVAIARCREALASSATHTSQHVSGSTVAAAFLAEACYAAGQIDEAQRLLDAYLPMIDEVAAPDQLITSYATLARIAHRRGEREKAAQHLRTLDRKGQAERLPRLCSSAHLEAARIALLDGDLDAARVSLDGARIIGLADPGGTLSLHATDVEGLEHGMARLALHEGRTDDALALLEPALERALAQGRLRRAHHLRVLLALTFERSGRADQAERVAREVAQMALEKGLSSAIEDEGPQASSLIERMGRYAAGARVQTVASPAPAGTARPETVEAAPAPAQPAVESLTPREMQVLRLLAEGDANRIIAQRMFVSEATVKTHLRSISAKLGAENRTHAVAIARRLGLLPRG